MLMKYIQILCIIELEIDTTFLFNVLHDFFLWFIFLSDDGHVLINFQEKNLPMWWAVHIMLHQKFLKSSMELRPMFGVLV